jgi:hypothetical protein
VAYVRAKTYLTRGGPRDAHTVGRDGRERVVRPGRFKGEARGIVTYYQLVESRRVNGQPRQRLIAHLGRYPSVDAAIRGLPGEIQDLNRRNCSELAIVKLQLKLDYLRWLRSQGVA